MLHSPKDSFAKQEIICSTIIPTVGRSSLTRTVESVLAQSLGASGLEVIVVNDSGSALPEADWQASDRIRIVTTNRRERSVARNAGASIARGRFLHFLDDDDWAEPDAYRYLQRLSQTSDAKWLYGITQLVDRHNARLIQLQHGLRGNCFMQVMAGEWIPLQSSWIERITFMSIGGFNPLLTGPEDIDLLRRFLLEEDAAETPHLIANISMGEAGSTTDYGRHPQASRRSREGILEAPQAFRRMQSSAANSFWRGRMVRVYLTSTLWNLINQRLFTATSRWLHSIAAMLTSGTSLLTPDFWRAVTKPYSSITFDQGFRAAQVRERTDV